MDFNMTLECHVRVLLKSTYFGICSSLLVSRSSMAAPEKLNECYYARGIVQI